MSLCRCLDAKVAGKSHSVDLLWSRQSGTVWSIRADPASISEQTISADSCKLQQHNATSAAKVAATQSEQPPIFICPTPPTCPTTTSLTSAWAGQPATIWARSSSLKAILILSILAIEGSLGSFMHASLTLYKRTKRGICSHERLLQLPMKASWAAFDPPTSLASHGCIHTRVASANPLQCTYGSLDP